MIGSLHKTLKLMHYLLAVFFIIILSLNTFENVSLIVNPQLLSLKIKAYGILSVLSDCIEEIILAAFIFGILSKINNDLFYLSLVVSYTVIRIFTLSSGLINHKIIYTYTFIIQYITFIILGMGIMLYITRLTLRGRRGS